MFFSGGLQLKLKSGFDMPSPETVNFAIRLPDGTLEVEQVALETLSKKIGQPFQWTDTVLILEDEELPKGSNRKKSDELIQQYACQARETQKKLAITKINDLVGYGVVALDNIEKDEVIGLYSGVYGQDTIDVISLPESSELEVLQMLHFHSKEILVRKGSQLFCLNRIEETIRDIPLEKEEIDLFDTQCQPTETVKTINSDKLSTSIKRKIGILDDYAAGIGDNFHISGREFRNFLPFISHAMPRHISTRTDYPEPSIDDFVPIDKTLSQDEWRDAIFAANITISFKGSILHNDIPFGFFFASEAIEKGQLLGWDYGIRYWLGQSIPPALLTKEGALVDSSTYLFTREEYRDFFNGPLHQSVEFISEDYFDSKMPLIIQEVARNYVNSLTKDEQQSFLRQLIKARKVNDLWEKISTQVEFKMKEILSDVYFTDEKFERFLRKWAFYKFNSVHLSSLIEVLSKEIDYSFDREIIDNETPMPVERTEDKSFHSARFFKPEIAEKCQIFESGCCQLF